jgi:predicted RNA-binding protein with PUA-like domain
MSLWLVKSDPEAYSFDDMEKDGKTSWDGVRNYQARNNIQLMKKGDRVLFYHSQIGKDIVGVTEVSKEAYNDPTTEDIRWFSVELKFKKRFKKTITLESMKSNEKLQNIGLIKQSRLSVMPIAEFEYDEILRLTK